jgi:acetyltransferase-like isoleucine patch superfamily enzyme
MKRILRLFGLLFSPFINYMQLKSVLHNLSVEFNPFSPQRKRPLISRYQVYTKDVLNGPEFEIGDYTYGTPIVLHYSGAPGQGRLRIGKFCSIALGVMIHLGGNHRTDLFTTFPFAAFLDTFPQAIRLSPEKAVATSKGDVVIGNDVWIGTGATILSGVTICDGAVIAANAVVASNVEPYAVVAGNPARVVKKRFDEDTIRRLLEIRWWDWPAAKINNNIQAILGNDITSLLQLK